MIRRNKTCSFTDSVAIHCIHNDHLGLTAAQSNLHPVIIVFDCSITCKIWFCLPYPIHERLKIYISNQIKLFTSEVTFEK